MSATYVCKEGDRLDQVVYRYYGFQNRALEAVMSHKKNHKLVSQSVVLHAGTTVFLPDLPAQAATPQNQIRLWDAWEGAS